MKLIDSYLSRNIIIGVMMALMVLVSLDALMAFIYQFTSHAKGDFGLTEVLLYVLYTLPRRVYDYFPTSMLLGGLLSLGAMATNSELVAIRAAGVTLKRMIGSVLKAGALLIVCVVAIGELVAPLGEEKAESMKVSAQTGSLVSAGATRLWVREGNQFVGIRTVLPDMSLRGVSIYQLGESRNVKAAISAPRAHYDESTQEWVLNKARISYGDGLNIRNEQHDEYRVQELLSPDLFQVVVVSPEKMSALSLWRYMQYLKDNNLDASHYELAFWVRFTTPFSSIVMLLIALPFVFSSQRTGDFGQRLFIGIVLGVSFFLLNRLLNHMGLVYGLPPILSATFPLIIFTGGAVWALKRIR